MYEKSSPSFLMSIDINPEACLATKSLLETYTEVINSDLFKSFRKELCFDFIIFNPPYVASDEETIRSVLRRGSGNVTYDACWAGGPNGRFWIDSFITALPFHLSSRGVALLLLIEGNKPLEVIENCKKLGLLASVKEQRKCGIERLLILRITGI